MSYERKSMDQIRQEAWLRGGPPLPPSLERKRRAKKKATRKQALNAAAARKGMFVRTHSPGDGLTRYAFFDRRESDPSEQSYFGPHNPIHTAMGLKAARAYLERQPSKADMKRKKRTYRSRKRRYGGR